MGLESDGHDVKRACAISQWKTQQYNVFAQSDSDFSQRHFGNRTLKGKLPQVYGVNLKAKLNETDIKFIMQNI